MNGPGIGPDSSKAKEVKKVGGERKPKTAKNSGADKKATAPKKKVGAKAKEKTCQPCQCSDTD